MRADDQPTEGSIWQQIKALQAPLSDADQERLDALMRRARRPLSTTDPRRHHYIPEFFQKRFATEEERLLAIRLSDGSSRISHVTNNAVIKDLYTSIDEEVGETTAVETLLAVLDSEAAQAIGRLDSETPFPLSRDDRGLLALWLAMLHVRGPAQRRMMEALGDFNFKLGFGLMANPDTAKARLTEKLGRDPTDSEVEELVDAAAHVNEVEVVPHQSTLVKLMLQTSLEMMVYLTARRFVLLEFPEVGLVLPDQPVVLNGKAEPNRSIGIANADAIIIPIDRRRVLLLDHGQTATEATAAPQDGLTVDRMNQVLASNAIDEVYCHPDDADRLTSLELSTDQGPLFQVTAPARFDVRVDGVNAPPVRKGHKRYRRRPGD